MHVAGVSSNLSYISERGALVYFDSEVTLCHFISCPLQALRLIHDLWQECFFYFFIFLYFFYIFATSCLCLLVLVALQLFLEGILSFRFPILVSIQVTL